MLWRVRHQELQCAGSPKRFYQCSEHDGFGPKPFCIFAVRFVVFRFVADRCMAVRLMVVGFVAYGFRVFFRSSVLAVVVEPILVRAFFDSGLTSYRFDHHEQAIQLPCLVASEQDDCCYE